jgi:hypothetical protein
MDDATAKAFRSGEANAEIVTLALNWCVHLQIQRWGGTGMVEEMTGLTTNAVMHLRDIDPQCGLSLVPLLI